MSYRGNRQKSDDDLTLKIATGVVIGGLVLLGIIFIHDKIQEYRAEQAVKQFVDNLNEQTKKAETEARWAAYRANERQDALSAQRERQRQIELQASRRADNERCMDRRLLRKEGNAWIQITGSEATLKCGR